MSDNAVSVGDILESMHCQLLVMGVSSIRSFSALDPQMYSVDLVDLASGEPHSVPLSEEGYMVLLNILEGAQVAAQIATQPPMSPAEFVTSLGLTAAENPSGVQGKDQRQGGPRAPRPVAQL